MNTKELFVWTPDTDLTITSSVTRNLNSVSDQVIAFILSLEGALQHINRFVKRKEDAKRIVERKVPNIFRNSTYDIQSGICKMLIDSKDWYNRSDEKYTKPSRQHIIPRQRAIANLSNYLHDNRRKKHDYIDLSLRVLYFCQYFYVVPGEEQTELTKCEKMYPEASWHKICDYADVYLLTKEGRRVKNPKDYEIYQSSKSGIITINNKNPEWMIHQIQYVLKRISNTMR